MKMNLKILSASVLLASVLVGCGGSSDSNSTSPTIQGVVSDGPIKNSVVKLMNGSTKIAQTTTNEKGVFSFSTTLSSDGKYIIEATGGTDVATGEDFTGLVLNSSLNLFENKKNVVVSPLTTLVGEAMKNGSSSKAALEKVKTQLDLASTTDLLKNPSSDVKIQKNAMLLSFFAKTGHSFKTIQENLDDLNGIDVVDVDKLSNKNVNQNFLLKNSLKSINDAKTDLNKVYKQQMYARKISENLAKDSLKASETTTEKDIEENLNALAQKFSNENLDDASITASLIGVNLVSTSFDVNKVKINKVDKSVQFVDSLKVFYYTVANLKTNNNQLLAYDLSTKKASVINTDVILGKKVFMYEGTKQEDKTVYTAKKYGFYLDPTQEKETRVVQGRYGPTVYNFYSNNALMKFNPSKPSQTNYIVKSTDIPKDLQDKGIKKLGKDFIVLENIVDTDNSYINLKGFDSLADLLKKESTATKKQTNLIVRLGDSKVVQGKAIKIVKNSEGKTDYILANTSDVYIPKTGKANYKLVKYSKDLSSPTPITDGEFYFATQNSSYVYLFKENSDKLWAFNKTTNKIYEVSDITLAGEYKHSVHAKAAGHGSNSALIDGATTLSGTNDNLSDGENAYLSFNYDLIPNVGTAFLFGKFGAYKNSQVFKLTEAKGVKIFDNGDGKDDSLNENNKEEIKGHVNLVAVKNDKIFVELGWYDTGCKQQYPYPGAKGAGQKCIAVKYGTLATTSTKKATDLKPLTYTDTNIEVKNLPYYIARRIAPVAVNDKVYISTFAGGTSKTGYEYKQYTFDFASNKTSIENVGRTYFVQSATRENGIYSGEVIIWDKNTQTIKNSKGETVVSTSDINGNKGKSIHAVTNGVPLAGIGIVAMLANNIGGASHSFELFLVDTEKKELHYSDLAPYGGWLYE